MALSFLQALQLAFHKLIPEPHLRTSLNASNVYVLGLPFFLVTVMGYLVRRPNTLLLRILLCPIVIITTIHSYYSHYWVNPRLNVYNWGAGLFGLAIIAKTVEYACAPHGLLKTGEESPGKMRISAIDKQIQNGSAHKEEQHIASGRHTFKGAIQDSIEVLCTMRGIGWEFGADVYVPEGSQSLKSFLYTFIKSFLVLDLLESVFKLLPQFSSPKGGSIFVEHLPPLKRYALSTGLHFMTGCSLIAGFHMVYSMVAIFCITALGHHPASWPPVFDKPWIATSLHDFWAKRWHQLLRRTFLLFGGLPLFHLLGFNHTLARVGLILGTFLASGLFHNLSIYVMGQGTSPETMIFFFAQGVGIILERLWKRYTGRRVEGCWGLAWVYLWIVGGGQLCIDSWHRRGLAGGLVIPPLISPTRQILWPSLARFF